MSIEQRPEDDLNIDMVQKRLERMRDLLVKSLNDADPLQANLGAGSTDLMSTALRLKIAIDEALTGGSDLLTQFKTLAPAIELYVKLQRQAGRFLEISRRWSADQAANGPPSSHWLPAAREELGV